MYSCVAERMEGVGGICTSQYKISRTELKFKLVLFTCTSCSGVEKGMFVYFLYLYVEEPEVHYLTLQHWRR